MTSCPPVQIVLDSPIVFSSPGHYKETDSGSGSGSGSNDSESTIEDVELYEQMGHPLERMADIDSVAKELRNMPIFRRESLSSESSGSTSSSYAYDMCVHFVYGNRLQL